MTINLDKIAEIAFLGIRRASAFLGLGINAAKDPRLVNYTLPTEFQLRVIPDDLSITQVKHDFEMWIILSGLRELVEHYAVFLDHIHHSALVITTRNAGVLTPKAQKQHSSFQYMGLEKKIEKLETEFGIASHKAKYLPSIAKARNCVAHRRGIVGESDVDAAHELTLEWWTMEVIAVTPAGEEVNLTSIPAGGVLLQAGGEIKLKICDRKRKFHKGQVLELTPQDLAEICFLTDQATRETRASMVAFAKMHGVPVQGSKQPEQSVREVGQSYKLA